MAEKESDVISPWFLAAEELGEYIGIRFGRLAPGATEPEWIFRRHSETDGIGGFAEILRQRGAELERLPQLRHPAPASSLAAAKLLPKFMKPRERIKWRPMKGGTQNSTSKQPPQAVAWHVFDEPTTIAVRRVCRRAGVTVNSFLVKHLTKAIRPFLEDESSIVPWMIPVNMRGKVSFSRDADNHSSYVGIKVRSYETVYDVHKNIYAALGKGEHWSNWQVYQLSRITSNGMRKFLIRKELAMSQWNLGGFSNLGDWDAENKITQPDCQGSWLFCPPVLRCQLVGAGSLTFQNRLSLVIQIHPELTTNSEVPAAWMENWVREIGLDVSSLLPKAPLMSSAA
jgi:hypothetical protein